MGIITDLYLTITYGHNYTHAEMEWFKVNWKGPYPIATAHQKPASGSYGLYAIYEAKGKSYKLLYIGETYWQSFGKRLRQHERAWLPLIFGRMVVCFGVVELSKGKHISHARVCDIEQVLIHSQRPPYNTIGKKGYFGRDILLFNLGKSIALPRLYCLDPELKALLVKK